MKHVRNVAIILLLALVVAEVPGGGEVAEAIVATITIGFLVLIGFAGYQFYRQNRLTYLSLEERWRAILVGALGAIVLMIAAADEMLESGLGLFAWLAIVGLSVYAIVRTYGESRAH